MGFKSKHALGNLSNDRSAEMPVRIMQKMCG